MKLLKRAEVSTQAAELKRQQVSEGMELVARVEALRKALSDLQQQHRAFIETSKIELARETTELFGQREGIKAEVEVLTKVREELKKPLTKEWNELKANQDKIKKQEKDLFDRGEELEKKELELEYDSTQVKVSLQKALEAEQQVNQRNILSEQAKLQAEEVLKAAQNSAQRTYELAAEREKEVSLKEEKVKFDLKANENVGNINKAKEQDLNERERAINDKYQQLLKTTEDVKHTTRRKPKASSIGNT